jgi:uncharacterized membrane protein
MSKHAAVTVLAPRDEVERLWNGSEHSHIEDVRFADAPGDRGTEIHVELGKDGLAKVKDELRRFKQRVETGD